MNIVGIIQGILAAIPAIEKILAHPAISKALAAFVGLFVKSEGEKAVEKFKDDIHKRKEINKEHKVAIRNAKESKTKAIEDLANRTK